MPGAAFLRLLSMVGLALPLLAALAPCVARAADPQGYTVKIAPTGNAALDGAIHDSATLISLNGKAPVSPFALIARARADIGRITTALHSYGYYLGTVAVAIDGLPVDDQRLPGKLDAEKSGSKVTVAVTPSTGPLFHYGTIALTGDVDGGKAASLGVQPGQPALAAQALQAGATLQSDLQDDGHVFAKVAPPVATLEIASHTLNLSYAVAAGPRADIGAIRFAGEQQLHASYMRRRLDLRSGQLYDPRKIELARQDLAAVPALASVRISPADALDSDGRIPLTVTVAERPRHAVNLGVAYSTDQGGSATASWTHRNLFGNAETLTLSASAIGLGGTATRQPGYDLDALLTLPDWLQRNQSLAFNLEALRQSLQAYDRKAALASVVLSRKLTPDLTASGGVAFEEARITQEGVTRSYTLPQLPLTLAFDNTGSLFDPIHGVKASLMLTPTLSLGSGRTSEFLISQLSAATYLDIGRDLLGHAAGRSILAVRGLVGKISGANTFAVPPDQRFYAGGGGTIRGWRYQSVGPAFPDRNPVGGTSIEVGTLEYRQRIGGSYGFVVFTDAGEVGSSGGGNYPGAGTVRIGAGAGFRYYTSVGPIRIDVAAPINKDKQVKTDIVEAYIGLGQAF